MAARTPRTLLEALIIQRRETFEEFSEAVTRFADEEGESGTLSARHAQRLASGARADGRPLGSVRPATERLLERMLGHPIDELLGPPGATHPDDETAVLTAQLAAARSADAETVAVFQKRLDLARLLDRRLGASHLVAELTEQVRQMEQLCRYSTDAAVRRDLAAIIADACTLIGWQWLDKGDPVMAWDYYARALTAATEAESVPLRAYVQAGQSVVLLDLNETAAAVQMTEHARQLAHGRAPHALVAWLAAAHGEAQAASNNRSGASRAFTDAENALSGATAGDAPFLVFGPVHLNRWRGSALARLDDGAAAEVLTASLTELPPGFARAEAAIHADLAYSYAATGDRETALFHAGRGDQIARQIGSARHRRRIEALRRRALSGI